MSNAIIPSINMIKFFSPTLDTSKTSRDNFRNTLLDGAAVGFATSANPFLAVFLTRLGASTFEVGLLTSMPALAGLIFAIPLSVWLQKQRNIVPWYSLTRLMQLSGFALTGLIPFLLPKDEWIFAILLIWGAITIPVTMLSILFNVVLSTVAGPKGRFNLLSKRWSLIGLVTTLTTLGIGQILKRFDFPINYQMIFLLASSGAIFTYIFSSRLVLSENVAHRSAPSGLFQTYSKIFSMVRKNSAFLSFTFKRFVFLTGVAFATPLFPLYYVRQAALDDNIIAIITTIYTATLIFGYLFWAQQSRSKGVRNILLWTTLGLALYPVLVALTTKSLLIILISGAAGVFQAGLDLVFFDELMKNIPPENAPPFVAFAQSTQYLTTMVAPLVSAAMADSFGFNIALMIAGGFQLIGFFLFLTSKRYRLQQK